MSTAELWKKDGLVQVGCNDRLYCHYWALGGTVDAVKIRKQGNSLAVTIDQPTLTAANLHEGDLVVPSVQRGLIVLTPVEVRPKVRSRVLEVGRKVIRENRGALDRLAKGGSGQVTTGRR